LEILKLLYSALLPGRFEPPFFGEISFCLIVFTLVPASDRTHEPALRGSERTEASANSIFLNLEIRA